MINALHGAGGVGKTQLAVEYAWRFAGGYEVVWWVNAEQADRIGEQYAALAAALRLVDPATPVGAAIEALRASPLTRAARRGRLRPREVVIQARGDHCLNTL